MIFKRNKSKEKQIKKSEIVAVSAEKAIDTKSKIGKIFSIKSTSIQNVSPAFQYSFFQNEIFTFFKIHFWKTLKTASERSSTRDKWLVESWERWRYG